MDLVQCVQSCADTNLDCSRRLYVEMHNDVKCTINVRADKDEPTFTER